MGYVFGRTTGGEGGLFGLDFDLTLEEEGGIGPDQSLFEGDPEEKEDLQTRPSPETEKYTIDDCGPDDPRDPLAGKAVDDCGPVDPLGPLGTLAIDDCGPEPLPALMSEFDTII